MKVREREREWGERGKGERERKSQNPDRVWEKEGRETEKNQQIKSDIREAVEERVSDREDIEGAIERERGSLRHGESEIEQNDLD